MPSKKAEAAEPQSQTPAESTTAQSADGARRRAAIKTYDLTDLRVLTLNGEAFPAGRRNVTLGLLKKRIHAAALPYVALLQSLGITDDEAVVAQVKVDALGRASRLYGIEVVRSKDSSAILLRLGDHQVELKQDKDKLTSEKLGGAISFETRTKLNSTETYLIAKAVLTTKVNPANYAVQIALDNDLKDDEGNPIDAASLLQADFNSGDYSTLMELMAPPKAPPILMHELPVGVYPVLSVAEPVVKQGKRRDGQPFALNSYAITIDVDGEPAVTYSGDDVMRQLDGIRSGLISGGIKFDPADLLDLSNCPHWLWVKDVQVKNPEAVEAGEEPKYRVVATLTDRLPLLFNSHDGE